jgi:hypothetical protein
MGKKSTDKEMYASCYQQPKEGVLTDCVGCGLPPAPVAPCPPCFAPDGAVPSDHLYDQLRAYLDAFCLNPVFVQYAFDFLKNPDDLKKLLYNGLRSIVQTFSCQGYHVVVDVFNQQRRLVTSFDASSGEEVQHEHHVDHSVADSSPELMEALSNIGRCGDCWDGLAIRGEYRNVHDVETTQDYCQHGAIFRARAFGDYRCNPYTYIVRFSISGTLNQFNMLVPTLTVIDTECKNYETSQT